MGDAVEVGGVYITDTYDSEKADTEVGWSNG